MDNDGNMVIAVQVDMNLIAASDSIMKLQPLSRCIIIFCIVLQM